MKDFYVPNTFKKNTYKPNNREKNTRRDSSNWTLNLSVVIKIFF